MASPELLTSRSSRVKAARRLTRRAHRVSEHAFLAEGPQAVCEALALPGCLVEVFATDDASQRHRELRESAADSGVAWRLVDDAALAGLCDTLSPQGVVGRCHALDVSMATVTTTHPRLVAVCASVRDPGNAGAVIRCADAAGADAVVLAGTSVDPYNGKAVRASAGSLFHLPIVTTVSVEDAVTSLREAGLVVLAADGAGADLDDLDDSGGLDRPTCWLFGNEAWGLPTADAALADQVVAVPIHGRAESLNLATAAAVCLYASARAQRRHVGGAG